MTKAKAKTARKSATRKPTQARTSKKPVDMSAVREKVTTLVGNSAVKMVKTTMGEVDKGHYTAMKYLFELVGLFPGGSMELELEVDADDSMARTLLERLRIPEETVDGTEVTKDLEAPAVLATEDAVK